MQQNPELAAMVNAAYANWQYVIVNESNANLYNEFFGILLPRMQQVMTDLSNQTGVLIDEHTYNLAMSIISEHSNVTDPGFLMFKEQIVTDLNVLKGRNYEAVRAWFRGELY